MRNQRILIKWKQFRRIYRNLGLKGRLAVGFGILAWGGIGLYMSDKAETKYGFVPSKEEKEVVDGFIPSITVVDKPKGN